MIYDKDDNLQNFEGLYLYYKGLTTEPIISGFNMGER